MCRYASHESLMRRSQIDNGCRDIRTVSVNLSMRRQEGVLINRSRIDGMQDYLQMIRLANIADICEMRNFFMFDTFPPHQCAALLGSTPANATASASEVQRGQRARGGRRPLSCATAAPRAGLKPTALRDAPARLSKSLPDRQPARRHASVHRRQAAVKRSRADQCRGRSTPAGWASAICAFSTRWMPIAACSTVLYQAGEPPPGRSLPKASSGSQRQCAAGKVCRIDKSSTTDASVTSVGGFRHSRNRPVPEWQRRNADRP